MPGRRTLRYACGLADAAAQMIARSGRELGRARRELDLAAAAADDAERHGRYVQAAQALSSAGRIMRGLADATAPPEPHRWGVAVNYGGAQSARAALLGPGLR